MSALLGRLPVGCLAGLAACGSPPQGYLAALLRAWAKQTPGRHGGELRPGRRAWLSR